MARFTPSVTYTRLLKGTSFVMGWSVYYRQVTTVSSSVSLNNWTDITYYVQSPMNSITSRLEYELGEATADTIQLTGMDIDYWNETILNTTDLVEIKLQTTVSDGNTTAGDTVIVYTGFVDMTTVETNETENTITFTCRTIDALADEIPAGSINTRYILSQSMGAIIMPNIPGLFCSNATGSASAAYPGPHTVSYTFMSYATSSIALDGGTATELYQTTKSSNVGSGTLWLSGEAGTAQFVFTHSLMPYENKEDYFYVENTSEGLPRNYFFGLNAKSMLNRLYTKAGILTQSYSDMTVGTWDGLLKSSIIDVPPMDPSVTGYKTCVSDGTDLWLHVAEKLYKRDDNTGEYILKATNTASVGMVPRNMFHDAANYHIITLFTSASVTKIERYTITTGALIESINLTGCVAKAAVVANIFNASSYNYQFLWVNNTTNDINRMFLTGSALDKADALGLGLTIDATLLFIKYFQGEQDTVYFNDNAGGTRYFRSIKPVADEQNWTLQARQAVNYNVDMGTWHKIENVLYCVNAGTDTVFSSSLAGGQLGACMVSGSSPIRSVGGSNAVIRDVEYIASTGKVIAIFSNPGLGMVPYTTPHIYALQTGSGYLVDTGITTLGQIAGYRTITSHTDGLYGIVSPNSPTNAGALFKVDDTISFSMDYFDYGHYTVREFINDISRAFFLFIKVGPDKIAKVNTRITSAGALLTPTTTLTVDTSQVSKLSANSSYSSKYDYIKVGNNIVSVGYDGASYGVAPLVKSKVYEIKYPFINDNILQDLAHHFWSYFNTDRKLYALELGAFPAFYIEPLDGVTFDGSTLKHNISLTNKPIISVNYGFDGTLLLEVLE